MQKNISPLEIGSSLYRWEVLGDVNFRRKEVPCTPTDGKVPDHGSSAGSGPIKLTTILSSVSQAVIGQFSSCSLCFHKLP